MYVVTVPFIGFHHILMVLLGLAIIFYSKSYLIGILRQGDVLMLSGLVLSGCSSNATSIINIYLISLSYQKTPASTSDNSSLVNPTLTSTFGALTNNTLLEVRAGYFGICVKGGNDQALWLCGSDTAKIARQFQPQQDPLNLIWVATRYKNGIVFSGLMYLLLFLIFFQHVPPYLIPVFLRGLISQRG